MKTLTNYIISNNIYSGFNECLDDDLNIIDEGKLGDTIAKFLGVSNMDHKSYSEIWGKDKESKKDMATAQVVAAVEKDPEVKKMAELDKKHFLSLEKRFSKEIFRLERELAKYSDERILDTYLDKNDLIWRVYQLND